MINIEKDKDLQGLNTLAVPSIAECYCEVSTVDQLKHVLKSSSQHSNINILSGGSNVLLAENIPGLVLRPMLRGVETRVDSLNVFVTAGAGENWHDFVLLCTAKGFYGLENLALIPGYVGSAPIQNIGAYGVELCDVFYSLQALNVKTLEIETFDAARCEFSYRESIFKQKLYKQYIITQVTFKLSKTPTVNLQYPALLNKLEQKSILHATPKDVLQAVIDVRNEKLPDPSVIPNVGSFFKNPIVNSEAFLRIKASYPDVVSYDVNADCKKLAAAWMIDAAGWKGETRFDIVVHDKQALVLTNPLKKGLNNILQLAAAIQHSVYEKFAVTLEIEPRLIE